MKVSLVAGFFYFLVVGAAGILFGSLREMFVSPVTGHGLAVILELPVMLAIAWFACKRLVKWCGVSDVMWLRLVMGVSAFLLLMVMEQSLAFALQKLIVGHAPPPWTSIDYLGFAAQIVFAMMPLFVMPNSPSATLPSSEGQSHKVPFPDRHRPPEDRVQRS
jgi:hypothetical protein